MNEVILSDQVFVGLNQKVTKKGGTYFKVNINIKSFMHNGQLIKDLKLSVLTFKNGYKKEDWHEDYKGKLEAATSSIPTTQAGSATYLPDGRIVPTSSLSGPEAAKAIKEKIQGYTPKEPVKEPDFGDLPF